MIEWPSDRVKPGGVFHPKRPSYSKETEKLLKVLMDESRLSNLQRQRIDYHLRNGSALNPIERQSRKHVRERHCFTARLRDTRRRTLDLIKSSGAYEQEVASTFGPFREPTSIAKKRLQESMSGFPGTSRIHKSKSKSSPANGNEVPDVLQEIEQLITEISERATWLDNMERLGQGKKYRTMIQNQITEKLQEIRRLERKQHETESTKSLDVQLRQLTLSQRAGSTK